MNTFYYITQQLQELSFFTITVRLCLSVLCGGIIGLERGFNKHQAGFRTHILVCVGATLAMLTNQYICETMAPASDPARLGAQVISGIGFLGVGTILVTGRYRITGLTTAAGLWASACMGLALGIGFYSGALVACALVFFVLSTLPSVELYFYNRSRVMDLYLELSSIERVSPLLKYLRDLDILIMSTHISRSEPVAPDGIGVYLSIKIPKTLSHSTLIQQLGTTEGIYLIEEI